MTARHTVQARFADAISTDHGFEETEAKLLNALAGVDQNPGRPQGRAVYVRGDVMVVLKARFTDLRRRNMTQRGMFRLMDFGTLKLGGDWALDRSIRAIHCGLAFRDTRQVRAPTDMRVWRALAGLQLELTMRSNGARRDVDRNLVRHRLFGSDEAGCLAGRLWTAFGL